MEFALKDGKRTLAAPKLWAQCPCCERPVVAKCGSIIRWHWSHAPVRHCDPWWETETEWHRAWKWRFPEAWREVVLRDGDGGEKHIADIRTPAGLTVEFQHSGMPEEERLSREAFYKDMIWVVDGARFIRRFHPLIPLPPPDSDLARQIRFLRHPRFPLNEHRPGRATHLPIMVIDKHIFRKDEVKHPDGTKTSLVAYNGGVYGGDGAWNSTDQTMEAIVAEHAGHYYIQWDRAPAGWLASGCRVFIDLGDAIWEIMAFPNKVIAGLQWTEDDFVKLVTGWRVPIVASP